MPIPGQTRPSEFYAFSFKDCAHCHQTRLELLADLEANFNNLDIQDITLSYTCKACSREWGASLFKTPKTFVYTNKTFAISTRHGK